MPRLVPRFSESRARETIELATSQVAQGMARERVCSQQNDVDQQHERAHAHSELSVKIERLKNVLPQETQEKDCEI